MLKADMILNSNPVMTDKWGCEIGLGVGHLAGVPETLGSIPSPMLRCGGGEGGQGKKPKVSYDVIITESFFSLWSSRSVPTAKGLLLVVPWSSYAPCFLCSYSHLSVWHSPRYAQAVINEKSFPCAQNWNTTVIFHSQATKHRSPQTGKVSSCVSFWIQQW